MKRISQGGGTGVRRWRRLRRAAVAGFMAVLVLLAGCAGDRNAGGPGRTENGANAGEGTGTVRSQADDATDRFRLRSLDAGEDGGETDRQEDGIIRLLYRNGQPYVPVGELARELEFKTSRDPETGQLRIGDNDVAFELKAGSTEASRFGDPVKLDGPAIDINGELYIPLVTVRTLFSGVFDYEIDGGAMRLKPREEPTGGDDLPDFRDDPNDPSAKRTGAKPTSAAPADMPAGAALKDIDVDALIKTAHQYIGVPYVFGAKPYPQSKVFDCSSFVQYVFGKYGVKLPRSSRKQAQVGQPVSRTSLRKGDLLFFYLPGRYKSNDIVGHVGIYIGNGKMIHSSNKPKDGVQVTDINKPFWKKTYLSARRVVY
jgi:hypothetical protein